MAKICVVTDSSVSLFPQEAKKLNIEVAPLSIMVDGKEYRDLINITPLDIKKALNEGRDITTSQPNIGYLDELFDRLKKENYDHIFVFTLASYLSGTFNAFQLAVQNNGLANVTLVDSHTVSGPIRHVSIVARQMADAGKSVEEITRYAHAAFENTITYILPDNLDQLRKGGRVKGAVATLSNLLKIKLCLYIDAKTTTIEKFDTSRTELKLFQGILDDMRQRGFKAETHKIYIPECDATTRYESFRKFLLEQEPGTETEVIDLPAGIAAHVGLNTYGVQMVLKA